MSRHRVTSPVCTVAIALTLAWSSIACNATDPKATVSNQTETALATGSTAKKTGAVLACDHPEHDFGTVAQGDEVKYTFTIKNVGDDVLNILSARGG